MKTGLGVLHPHHGTSHRVPRRKTQSHKSQGASQESQPQLGEGVQRPSHRGADPGAPAPAAQLAEPCASLREWPAGASAARASWRRVPPGTPGRSPPRSAREAVAVPRGTQPLAGAPTERAQGLQPAPLTPLPAVPSAPSAAVAAASSSRAPAESPGRGGAGRIRRAAAPGAPKEHGSAAGGTPSGVPLAL